MPVMPVVSWRPATIPATWLPWPFASFGTLSPSTQSARRWRSGRSGRDARRSRPSRRRRRSGPRPSSWRAPTPAARRCRRRPPRGTAPPAMSWPVFSSPHWSRQYVSAVAAWTGAFGSAYTTSGSARRALSAAARRPGRARTTSVSSRRIADANVTSAEARIWAPAPALTPGARLTMISCTPAASSWSAVGASAGRDGRRGQGEHGDERPEDGQATQAVGDGTTAPVVASGRRPLRGSQRMFGRRRPPRLH